MKNSTLDCLKQQRLIRLKLIENADTVEKRGLLLQRCKRDLLFFVNNFCVAVGTLVVTDRGLVPIEEITFRDKVWDGEFWVSQKGAYYQGRKYTMFGYGIYLTPDHKIWTIYGWKIASERHDRAEIRIPRGYEEKWSSSWPKNRRMALSMRLRKGMDSFRRCFAKGSHQGLRMPKGAEADSRHDRKENIQCLADHEGALLKLKNKGIPSLRWARDQCMLALGKVRDFFERHGRACGRVFNRQDGQLERIFAGQLSMGDGERASEQHAQECDHSHFSRIIESQGSRESGWGKIWNNPNADKVWGKMGQFNRSEEHAIQEDVYDLIDCGPRQAFTVIDADGRPLLVHNCWTYDPRPEAAPHHHPFILYDFQEQYLMDLEAAYKCGEDVLTEKSRDMGATWIVLSLIVWHWLFDNSFNALVGSRKEDYVDNREVDSLFGKMDYLIKKLPGWMKPLGWEENKHRNYMRLSNPENGNAIQGESSNADFSRAGRYSLIFMDEFVFWPFAGAAWTATADSAPTRFVVSTSHGKNNKFAQLRWPEEPNSEKIKIISLHWKLHPKKDEEWYAREKERRTQRDIAQELDLNYEASGNEKVFPEIVVNRNLRRNALIDGFDLPKEESRLPSGKVVQRFKWPMSGGLDYGTRSKSAFTVYARDYDNNHFAIWEWGYTMQQLIDRGWKGSMVGAIAYMLKNDCPYYAELDVIRADPSLWTDSINTPDGMTSIWRQLSDEGITKLAKGAQSDIDFVQYIKTLWADEINPQFRIFVDKCPQLVRELENLMWDDWSEALGSKRDLKEKIVQKDNHFSDNLKYYIMGRPQPPKKEPEFVRQTYDQRVREYSKKRKEQLARMRKGQGNDPVLGSKW